MPRSRQRLFEELDRLPQGLREHIERVRREASALARRHEVDAELTDLAAAAHDIARAFSPQELLGQAQGYGLTIHPVEEHLPILLHGPVAAHLLMAWGEEEPQVVEAVRWHSTAQRGLSDLGNVIFLADKLDPTKERRYPFIG